jgi:hypothetical protein
MMNAWLTERGFKVFTLPETATMFVKAGANIIIPNDEFSRACRMQYSITKNQIEVEDIFYDLAREEDKPCVIICDRGVLDNKAYMDEKVWKAIMQETGWNTVHMLNRYDAVIHLVTAADGAEEFYSLSNEARSESPELA